MLNLLFNNNVLHFIPFGQGNSTDHFPIIIIGCYFLLSVSHASALLIFVSRPPQWYG